MLAPRPFRRHVRHRVPGCSTSRSTSLPGLPRFTIVGVPDAAYAKRGNASAPRCETAGIPSSTGRSPSTSRRPLRKVGSALDLPVAIAFLRIAGLEAPGSTRRVFVGELGLNGEIRPTRGALCPRPRGARRGLRRARPARRPTPRKRPRSTDFGSFRPGLSPPSSATSAERRRSRPNSPPIPPPVRGGIAEPETSRRSGDRRRRAARSRSPPPAATTFSSRVLPERARRCSPGASRRSCRPSDERSRSR